jgi:hypothetical protein
VVITSPIIIMPSPMQRPALGLQLKSYEMFDVYEKSCIFAEWFKTNPK